MAKVEGYAENDLEFEQNSGQFSQLNVFHNTAVVHRKTNHYYLQGVCCHA